MHLGIAGVETRQRIGQHELQHDTVCRDRDLAARCVALVAQAGVEFAQFAKQRPRALDVGHRVGRGLERLRRAIDQGSAELCLEGLHKTVYRRRRDVKVARSGVEAALVDHGHEVLQTAQLVNGHRCASLDEGEARTEIACCQH